MHPEREIDDIVPPLNPERFRHFHAPTLEEIAVIDSYIAIADDYLFQSGGNGPNAPDESISRRREEYTSLKAPIRRLPAEIFHKIFELGVFEKTICITPKRAREDRVSVNHFLDLCAVCYAFREMVLSHGLLWSKMLICTDLINHDTIKYLDIILRRSSGYPLTFVFSMHKENDVIDNPAIASLIFERLLRESDRWYRVAIDVARNIRSMLQKDESRTYSFSQLRIFLLSGPHHVEIDEPNDDEETTSIVPVSLFGTTFAISTLDLHLVMLPTDIHLPNLTSLAVYGVHRIKDILGLLSQCPNLKGLTLKFYPMVMTQEGMRVDLDLEDEVSLPKLATFQYEIASPQTRNSIDPALESSLLSAMLYGMFSCLKFPALKRLRVTSGSNPSDPAIISTLALLGHLFLKSESPLERVELVGTNPGHGIQMIVNFPSISSLRISSPVTRLALEWLKYKEGDAKTHLFPRLSLLDLTVSDADAQDPVFQRLLIEMVESRTLTIEGRRKLRRLLLHHRSARLPQVLVDGIQRFAEKGLIFRELDGLVEVPQ